MNCAGMALYVDGQLIGTTSTSSAQAYTGYWRVGGDNLNGWNLDPVGQQQPGHDRAEQLLLQRHHR